MLPPPFQRAARPAAHTHTHTHTRARAHTHKSARAHARTRAHAHTNEVQMLEGILTREWTIGCIDRLVCFEDSGVTEQAPAQPLHNKSRTSAQPRQLVGWLMPRHTCRTSIQTASDHRSLCARAGPSGPEPPAQHTHARAYEESSFSKPKVQPMHRARVDEWRRVTVIHRTCSSMSRSSSNLIVWRYGIFRGRATSVSFSACIATSLRPAASMASRDTPAASAR